LRQVLACVWKLRAPDDRILDRCYDETEVAKLLLLRTLRPHGNRTYFCADFLVEGCLPWHANRYGKAKRNKFVHRCSLIRFALNLKWKHHVGSHERCTIAAPAACVYRTSTGLVLVWLTSMRCNPKIRNVNRVQNFHAYRPVRLAPDLYRREPGKSSCYVMRLRPAPDCCRDWHRYVYTLLAG